uniref:Uncharacterized protein n=1 Tax=Arundo donax TaxID=35708 RepID=A0A0A9TLV9_ARUDO
MGPERGRPPRNLRPEIESRNPLDPKTPRPANSKE